MKKLLLTYTFILLFFLCNAQVRQRDSLKAILKTAKEDTNKVNILNNLSRGYRNSQCLDTSLQYANLAVSLARILGFKKGEARAFEIKGLVYDNQGNYPEALKNDFACLKLREDIGDKEGIANIYLSIGMIYDGQCNYSEALKNYIVGLKLYEEIGNKQRLAASYNNIGKAYAAQRNYTEALKNHFAYLKINKEIGDKSSIANAYNEIANDYGEQGNLIEALKNHSISLKINKEIDDKYSIGESYNNIGVVYSKQGNFTEALKNYFTSLKIYEEIDDESGMALPFFNIGDGYYSLKNYKQAEEYTIKGLNISKKRRYWDLIKSANENLTKIYIAMGKSQKAVDSYKAAMLSNDSIKNEEGSKKTLQIQMQYNFDKKEAVDSLKTIEERKINEIKFKQEKTQRYALYFGLTLVIIFSGLLYKRFRLTNKQKQIIEEKNKEVEEKHKEIKDSINYAERIQRSFLATKQLLTSNLNDHFVFFRPKDVVSGDFYWASKLSNGSFALATADSTGHGVPGAIMSILNISCLENAVKEGVLAPKEILNHTRINIIERLKKDGTVEGGKDGMDCSLICFDFQNGKLIYSAANNPVWIVRDNLILEFAPDKMPVGKHDRDSISFTQHEVALNKGDVVYTITDGMPDQFGGPKGKKYMYKKLKELFITISGLSMDEQREKIKFEFESWKGNIEQVDDVTVIGVRI